MKWRLLIAFAVLAFAVAHLYGQAFTNTDIEEVEGILADIDPQFALPEGEPPEVTQQRDARISEIVGLLHSRYSEVTDFALMASVELGLSADQIKAIKLINVRDPIQLMQYDLGFEGAVKDSDVFYLQDGDAYAKSLPKLADAISSQQRKEQAKVDEILDKDQRALLRELHFEQLIDHDPLRALVALGLEANQEQQKRILKVLHSPYTSRESRIAGLVELLKSEFGEAKIRPGLTGSNLGSLNVQTADSVIDSILYFGGIHPNLRETSRPHPDEKCGRCSKPFDSESRGYRLGQQAFHDRCFVNAIVHEPVQRTKSNPRRAR